MSIYGWMALVGFAAVGLFAAATVFYALFVLWQDRDYATLATILAVLILGSFAVIGVVGLYAEAKP